VFWIFLVVFGLCQLATPSCHALKKLSAFPKFGMYWDFTKMIQLFKDVWQNNYTTSFIRNLEK